MQCSFYVSIRLWVGFYDYDVELVLDLIIQWFNDLCKRISVTNNGLKIMRA